jgi:integrase
LLGDCWTLHFGDQIMASGKITQRSIDAMISSEADGFLWDSSIKGFGAKFSKFGAVTYILQFRMGGRESRTRRYTIGSHGSPWTATTARLEAERLALQIAQGIDPAEAEKQRRRETVDLAFANYADRFTATCDSRGWGILVERSLRIHVTPVLRQKPLPQITRTDIVAIFDRMPSAHKANHRNVFAVIRRLFRWAVSRGDIERSPMEGMETPPAVKARDRWLSDSELGRVWSQAMKTHRCFGPIVRMLIVTGQRREEVASLVWEELDRDERLWTLPGARAKNGEPNRVPLNDLAIRVLDEVAAGTTWPKRGKIFPTSTGGPFTAYHKGKLMLDELVSSDGGDPVDHWRLHDLRRTVATGFQRLGVRFEVTEAILNHVGGSRAGVAGIYQRHDWKDEKREALTLWNDHLYAIIAHCQQ